MTLTLSRRSPSSVRGTGSQATSHGRLQTNSKKNSHRNDTLRRPFNTLTKFLCKRMEKNTHS